jgi:hypothetical protein
MSRHDNFSLIYIFVLLKCDKQKRMRRIDSGCSFDGNELRVELAGPHQVLHAQMFVFPATQPP